MIGTFRRQIAMLAVAGVAAAGGPLALTASAAAESWPARYIRLVVPYPPGGATDVVARNVAQELSAALKQQVVVDNVPGAGGSIGSALVARAKPDGYTLLTGTIATHAINLSVMKDLNYRLDDFTPVVELARMPNVLVVHPSVPAKSLAELVAHARANPGKLNFASSGVGQSTHLAGELFKHVAKLDIVHVPYRGSAPAVTDLLAGQVQMMFDNLASALPHIQAGKLRPLAVTASERSELAPDIPTTAEAGYPALAITAWFGIFAPAKTPSEIVARVNQETNAALSKPDFRARLARLGAAPGSGSPAEFAERVSAEARKWADLVREANVKLE